MLSQGCWRFSNQSYQLAFCTKIWTLLEKWLNTVMWWFLHSPWIFVFRNTALLYWYHVSKWQKNKFINFLSCDIHPCHWGVCGVNRSSERTEIVKSMRMSKLGIKHRWQFLQSCLASVSSLISSVLFLSHQSRRPELHVVMATSTHRTYLFSVTGVTFVPAQLKKHIF